MCALCDRIESAVFDSARDEDAELEATALLARWNARASRHYEAAEFRGYAGAMTQEEFAKGALLPAPTFVADLTWSEARAVIESVASASLDVPVMDFFVRWLEVQFAGANVSDLIFWPDLWFGDRDAGRHAFTPDELLQALVSRTGRTLPEAREVTLPFAVPQTT